MSPCDISVNFAAAEVYNASKIKRGKMVGFIEA